MKKKILSLLLVISLMCTLTVTSFAGTEKSISFNLTNGDATSIFISSSDIDSGDDRLRIKVSTDFNPSYRITVYDLKDGEEIFSKNDNAGATMSTRIHKSHSYIVTMQSKSNNCTGTLTVKPY